jgi:hypothetical protein
MFSSEDEWDHLAWSGGMRRFRAADEAAYRLRVTRGVTGRVTGAALSRNGRGVWNATRGELLEAGAARCVLPSGEELVVIVESGLEERIRVELDGGPCPFEPAKAMKLVELAALVRKGAWRSIGAGAFIGLLVLGGFSKMLRDLTGPDAGVGMLVSAVILLALGYVGFGTLHEGLDRLRGERSTIVRLVKDTPHAIAWVYYEITKPALQLVRGGETALVVRTRSGARHHVPLSMDAIEPAIRLVAKRAPNAQVGYTEEARAIVERVAARGGGGGGAARGGGGRADAEGGDADRAARARAAWAARAGR